MNFTQESFNSFIDKYIKFVDDLSLKYRYESNIKHLLYLIVPAFVVKYGVINESTILNCFSNTQIVINDTKADVVTASFSRNIRKDGSRYVTEKFVFIYNYSLSGLSGLIDNIVHEFNHAINSYNNEVTYDDKYIYLRTGLSYLVYSKDNLRFIKKSLEVNLEEILNTAQTEEIINIINSFNKYNISNSELATTLYSLKREISSSYESDAYSFQKKVCSDLINNKTFAPTVNNLRFKGFVEDIPNLFDNVLGSNGNYKNLNSLLGDIHTLILKWSNARFFKQSILNKIISKSRDVSSLIREYESKCIFK